MVWQAGFAWNPGDRMTSAKMAQMIEQLTTHDHRFDGSRGTPQPRFMHGVATESRAAIGFLTTVVSFGTRFDAAGPTPRIVVSIDTAGLISGGVTDDWGISAIDHTSADVRINRTTVANTTFRWLAVQAIA